MFFPHLINRDIVVVVCVFWDPIARPTSARPQFVKTIIMITAMISILSSVLFG